MRIALVAMPWAFTDLPSAAVGSLAAVLRRETPEHHLDCYYAYLRLYRELEPIYNLIAGDHIIGDLLCAAHVYPERTQPIRAELLRWSEKALGQRLAAPDTPATLTITPPVQPAAGAGADGPADQEQQQTPAERLFEQILAATGHCISSVVDDLSAGYDLVGFTTSLNQLYSSLAVAKQLKQRCPKTRIVLGGAGVSSTVGASVLEEYGYLDMVVQGEGETRLLHIVRCLASDGQRVTPMAGVLTRDEPPAGENPPLSGEAGDLGSLPFPDYREYYELAEEINITAGVAIEGSRGCWWDRSRQTGDPFQACFFCGLNKCSYRVKSPERIAAEMCAQAERHHNLCFAFLDNVLRYRGVSELAEAIRSQGKDFLFVHEVRANTSPHEMLELWQAGCEAVLIGIESLSTAYLQRLGKGTSTIRNLQMLKVCDELGIVGNYNLLTHFPGATEAEVAETASNLRHYAICYQAPRLSPFRVCRDSTVHRVPEHFGVSNFRNAEIFRAALPEEVFERLELVYLDHDCEVIDWGPVEEARAHCIELQQQLRASRVSTKPLSYRDGGTFLEIIDQRDGLRLITLEGLWREIYLSCMEIRSRADILRRFGDQQTATGETSAAILDACVAERLMFREGGAHLSLAVAPNPRLAAERIRSTANRSVLQVR